jgi:hypothetical protein
MLRLVVDRDFLAPRNYPHGAELSHPTGAGAVPAASAVPTSVGVWAPALLRDSGGPGAAQLYFTQPLDGRTGVADEILGNSFVVINDVEVLNPLHP